MRRRFKGKTRRGRRHTYEVRPLAAGIEGASIGLAWAPKIGKWVTPGRGLSLRPVRSCRTIAAALRAVEALRVRGGGDFEVQVVRSGVTPVRVWRGR
jgi:hypothetical protein